jgi:hypothetical protein
VNFTLEGCSILLSYLRAISWSLLRTRRSQNQCLSTNRFVLTSIHFGQLHDAASSSVAQEREMQTILKPQPLLMASHSLTATGGSGFCDA